MENCSDHLNDDEIHLLQEARLRIIASAPHATQVFHVLDLTVFRVLKKRPTYDLSFRWNNAIVKCIMKVYIYHDFRRTMIPPNILFPTSDRN
jgi:hypothetical protein